jgi:hypothetical protein
LQAKVTPTGTTSYFTRTFGNGTFASISLESTSEPTDVGINLANTRISANTGSDQFFALAPPYILGLDDGTSDLTFTSSEAANLFAAGPPEVTGTITFSKLATNVPPAITGHTITGIPTEKGETTTAFRFTNQNFTLTVGKPSSGTYTYSPYSPTMALVQTKFTSGNNAPGTGYLLLNFESTTSGTFVASKKDESGVWQYTPGNFTFTTTK